MSIYTKILGLPFFYKKLRPFLMGFNEKKDFRVFYDQLCVEAEDVIVDIGCGMGNAMNYIQHFSVYHGFDTDKLALMEFNKNYSTVRAFLHNRCFNTEDAININPTKVCMFGLLHHISDMEVKSLFESVSQSRLLKRIVTCDSFYGGG